MSFSLLTTWLHISLSLAWILMSELGIDWISTAHGLPVKTSRNEVMHSQQPCSILHFAACIPFCCVVFHVLNWIHCIALSSHDHIVPRTLGPECCWIPYSEESFGQGIYYFQDMCHLHQRLQKKWVRIPYTVHWVKSKFQCPDIGMFKGFGVKLEAKTTANTHYATTYVFAKTLIICTAMGNNENMTSTMSS